MHEEIIISGFGGQGALFVGQLLTYAGLAEGRQVTWIPSYGPEMRGGTAHCIVILSDDPIGSPIIRNPTVAVALNPASMTKYEPLVKPGGVLVVNRSLVRETTARTDLQTAYVPANEIANELGNTRMANMVLLGALLALRPLVQLASISRALDEHMPAHRQKLIEPNKRALARGAQFVREGQ
ncbi:MAG: 2-oxoacid:ferredoxin oxidoreductase subunit gamma [Chloroflexi bacterium]|nr:2-oxoacid:ferredoxin oxidoreductase subunit gamma [Chloroflexota bacterium]